VLDQLLHPVHQDHTPWLDRTGPDWLGVFPGLGTVRVAPDGGIGVELVDGPAPEREQALRHGWGEPLALARSGHHLASGATLAAGGRAVLVHGAADEVARLALGLAGDGWTLLADGLCPLTETGGQWQAHARPGPLLVRRRVAGSTWTEGLPARGGTDTVALRNADDVPDVPLPLAAVLHVHRCTGAEPVALAEVTGAERLGTVAGLLVGGVLAQPADGPDDLLRRHLSLAAVPAARLGCRPRRGALAMALIRAWPATAGPPGAGR
jgi:hypothetical protein